MLLFVNAPTIVVLVSSSVRTNNAEPLIAAAALGVWMRVTPCPGGINSSTVPFVSLKFRVFGKNLNTACSPTLAKDPSLKRKSAREARPVDNLSPGTIASDFFARRVLLFWGKS
jgi:hypothetical protein